MATHSGRGFAGAPSAGGRGSRDEGWTQRGRDQKLVDTSTIPPGLNMTRHYDRSERESPRAGWATAKSVLREVLRQRGVEISDDAIGRVSFLGEG